MRRISWLVPQLLVSQEGSHLVELEKQSQRIMRIVINHMWYWMDKLQNLLILEDGGDLRI